MLQEQKKSWAFVKKKKILTKNGASEDLYAVLEATGVLSFLTETRTGTLENTVDDYSLITYLQLDF